MTDQQGTNGARAPISQELPEAPATSTSIAARWHAGAGAGQPRYGVYVNNRAAVFMGEAFSLDRLLDNAVIAEQVGLDFVSVGDSITAKPRYTAIPVLAAIAARTKRVGLATGILQPHMRNPVLLAQDWATLDVISGGRTLLGVGLGTGDPASVAREYEVVGVPKRKRGRAFDESITLLKRLWTEESVTFDGDVFHLDDVSIGYRPVQSPHPPIVIACGGYVPKRPGFGPNDFYTESTAGTFTGPFDRVARLGDGWLTGIVTAEEYRQALAYIRQTASERHGRTLGPEFITLVNLWFCAGPNAEAARREGQAVLEAYHLRPFDDETINRWLLYGAVEDCAARIAEYVLAGANTFQFVIASYNQEGQIRALAERVLPMVAQMVEAGRAAASST
jgi:alkanesulfonate monooxygenase SsuD/methylene tetrahydromethanopterin reductase-like flavin-dependent oxidoreductase (luciferase family)